MSIEHPEHRTENLPSLDEIAEVPVTHSDKVHGEENWSGVQEAFHGDTAKLDATQSDRVLTGQRTVEEELGERAKDNKGHMPKIVGGVVALIVLGGGIFGWNKATGGDKNGTAENPAPTPDTVAGAPAVSGEITEKSPSDLIGKPTNSSIELLNTYPSSEVIDSALEPVTVEDYPTAEEAFIRLSQNYNVYGLSATVDTNANSEFPETEDSIILREKILSNILGESASSANMENENNIRRNVAAEFWFVNDSEAAGDKKATWSEIITPDIINQIDESTYEIEATSKLYTNIPEVDRYFAENPTFSNIEEAREGAEMKIQMSNDGTTWHWDNFEAVK